MVTDYRRICRATALRAYDLSINSKKYYQLLMITETSGFMCYLGHIGEPHKGQNKIKITLIEQVSKALLYRHLTKIQNFDPTEKNLQENICKYPINIIINCVLIQS